MAHFEYETDETDDTKSLPASDSFAAALALCDLTLNAKTIKAQLKQRAKLEKQIAAAKEKLAGLSDKETALNARDAALDARQAVIAERETAFEAVRKDGHARLREYHSQIQTQDKQLRWRIMAYSDLLSGYSPDLQDLPTWKQLRRAVPGLPEDPPESAEGAPEPHYGDPRADRDGQVFLGTLSRVVGATQ
jgi:hypothetical protein